MLVCAIISRTLAAKLPRNSILRARKIHKPSRHSAQKHIRGAMAIDVVDMFEPVQVEHQQSKSSSLAFPGSDGLLEKFPKQDSVRRRSRRVMMGLERKPLVKQEVVDGYPRNRRAAFKHRRG
jgi:hypothetical protein